MSFRNSGTAGSCAMRYGFSMGTLFARCVVMSVALVGLLSGKHCLADEPAKTSGETPVVSSATLFLADHLVRVHLGGEFDRLLGLDAVPAEQVLQVQLGLTNGQGLVVTKVDKDGPAAKAGIQINDVLFANADKDIADLQEFQKQLKEAADKTVRLGLVRAGTRRFVELVPRKAELGVVSQFVDTQTPRYWLGVALAVADATLRSQLNIPEGEGLVVTTVEADSPAAKSGVMVNDILLKLDGKALKTIEDLSAGLQGIGNKSASLELLRRGKPATLTVVPENRPLANLGLQLQTPSVQSVLFAIPEHNATWSALSSINRDVLLLHPQGAITWSTPESDAIRGELASQVERLQDQTRQLQASLESLKTAIQKQGEPVKYEESKAAKP